MAKFVSINIFVIDNKYEFQNHIVMKKENLIIAFLLFSYSLTAQWQKTTGPCYASINCTYFDSTTIYAGSTSGKMYISYNGGNRWNISYPSSSGVNAITKRDVNLFIGTNKGIFVSITNGANWFSINNGLSNTTILSMSTIGQKILAGTAGGGIYITSNDGASWDSINNGLPSNAYINSIVVHGTSIYAGTNSGLYLSTNNGNSWNLLNIDGSVQNIQSVAIRGSNIFVGTFNNGLFVSIDNGQTWNSTNNGLTNPSISSIAFFDNKVFVGTKYGGIFYSANNGSIWNQLNTGLIYINIKSLVSTGTSIFAGTIGGGLYRLSTTTNSWSEANSGISRPFIYRLYSDSTILYSVTLGNGIFTSTNNGVQWEEKNHGKESSPYNLSIAKNGQNMYTGGGNNIFTSNNNGDYWHPFSSIPILYSDILSFLFTDSTIFVGTLSEGIYTSTNNGASWSSANTGFYYTPTVNTIYKRGSKIFAGLLGDGLYSSVNNGLSWNYIPLYNYRADVSSIIEKDSSIYVGADDCIFSSNDNGLTWVQLDSGIVGMVNCLVSDGTTVYAATNNGVFKLLNNAIWVDISNGIASGTKVFSLAIHDSTLFAGTDNGIWRIPIANIVSVHQSLSRVDKIKIFPNPASEFVQIYKKHWANKEIKIEFYSISGSLVKESVIYKNNNRITISDLDNGSYIVKLISDNKSSIQKLLIRK